MAFALRAHFVRPILIQSELSLIMIDIDGFRQFNDRFGHLAGDYALHAVAQTLRDSVRPTDMLARFGGEEFMVILPDTDIEKAVLVAERIRRNVAEATIIMSDESLLPPANGIVWDCRNETL